MARRKNLQKRVIENARDRGVVVVRRWQWGSIYNYYLRYKLRPHHKLPDKAVDTVWAHVTVTQDTGRTMKTFRADVRTVERIGISRFFSGVSYNWLIDAQQGWVAEGQPLRNKGTHTVNDKDADTPNGEPLSYDQNVVSIAFAIIGMPGMYLSEKAGEALIELLAAHIEEGAVTRSFDLLPHSLVAWKDCPTQAVRDVLPSVRRKAIRRAK